MNKANNYVYSDEKSQFKASEYSLGFSKYQSNSVTSNQKQKRQSGNDTATTMRK